MVTSDVAMGDAFYRTLLCRTGTRRATSPSPFSASGQMARDCGEVHASATSKPLCPVEPAESTPRLHPMGGLPCSTAARAAFRIHRRQRCAEIVEGRRCDAKSAVPGVGRHGLPDERHFSAFELSLDWKTPPNGNSDVKYRLFYMFHVPTVSDAFGHEYQMGG